MSQREPRLESSEQRAAEYEREAQDYESAADEAARTGHGRRARQLLQSAWASRRLAAEVRRQTPALIAGAGRALAQSAAREASRVRRQTAERERTVRRWLRRIGPR